MRKKVEFLFEDSGGEKKNINDSEDWVRLGLKEVKEDVVELYYFCNEFVFYNLYYIRRKIVYFLEF